MKGNRVDKICMFCKSANRSNAKFCSKCGKSFGDSHQSRQNIVKKRYLIEKLIFSDMYGNSYLAKDMVSEEWVVVKEDTEPEADEEQAFLFQLNFQKASKQWKRLSYHHIAKVYEAFYHKGKYKSIIQFVPGTPLNKLLQNKKNLPLSRAFQILVKICELTEILHCQIPPIYHLNIKPSKIIITSSSEINLIPWVAHPRKGQLIGTRGYASPEQYRGEYDERSDIYNLAALGYHLITGIDPSKEPPFHFLPISTRVPKLKGNMEDIFHKALSLNPSKRFSTIREFRQAILHAMTKYSILT